MRCSRTKRVERERERQRQRQRQKKSKRTDRKMCLSLFSFTISIPRARQFVESGKMLWMKTFFAAHDVSVRSRTCCLVASSVVAARSLFSFSLSLSLSLSLCDKSFTTQSQHLQQCERKVCFVCLIFSESNGIAANIKCQFAISVTVVYTLVIIERFDDEFNVNSTCSLPQCNFVEC